MAQLIHNLALTVLLAPLAGALVAGLFGKKIGVRGAHSVTILGVAIALVCALSLCWLYFFDNAATYNGTIYVWGHSGRFSLDVGFLVDHLSVLMMTVVTFVSLLVHIYSIRYMLDDPGYQRFFSYMSLFTFGMMSLVLANNFLLLFFGWEAVGVVSYLLIGFWFNKESAADGSFKAFIVNRVGDFGFLLGIGLILSYFGALDYATVFAKANSFSNTSISLLQGHSASLMTVICLLLFIGAMGKSAQIPLHIWLPESMEGPTPISALIHAATMVTAGVYMVARLSPLFDLSPVALSVVMIVGATGALLLGLLAVVEHDIKRVIAYSTMSQLGYMMAANGAAAYAAGIFHLATHACFKALLFLGAGSVIIATHHQKNLHKMGGLRSKMPITYGCFLIGTLAITAIPPFAGFYSKDAIIEAVSQTNIVGHTYAYWCLLMGAFVTSLYSFRGLFLAFHGKTRMSQEEYDHIKESPAVVTVPLILLSIPSVFLGMALVKPMLYQKVGLLSGAIKVLPNLDVLSKLAEEYHGLVNSTLHALTGLPFWFGIAGLVVAYVAYIRQPDLPDKFAKRFSALRWVLVNKYGFDAFNDVVFVRGSRKLSSLLYRYSDLMVIDGIVNGAAKSVQQISAISRRVQSGYLYHYAFAMMLGLLAFLFYLIWW